jgi:hypothetical protein
LLAVAHHRGKLGQTESGGLREQFKESVAANLVQDVVEQLALLEQTTLQRLRVNRQSLGDVGTRNGPDLEKAPGK